MRLAFLAATILAAAGAAAQAPHENWRTIETRHFRVHYALRFEAWATRAASRLESIRDAVVAEVGFAPEQKTDVLVVDPIADANGQTIPLLDTPRMIFYAHAPGPELQIGEYSDWIDLLAVHETAHLVHLLRPSRNPVERFIERWLLPVNPIVLRAPRWIFEGYATVIEGRITGSGRPSGTMRAAILRKWALEGRLPTYGQLDSDRRFLGMSMAYLMGSAFLEWLEQREGPDAMRHMWARLTARQRRSFDEAFLGVYGERADKLYGEFVAQLTASATALARAQPPVEGTLWQETARGSGDLAVAPDGKSLAMVLRNEKREAKLVVLSTGLNEEEEKYRQKIETILKRDPQDVVPVRNKPLSRKPLHTLMPADGGDITEPRWTRDGRSIVYTHKQPDRDGFLHEDLFRWTPESGENARVTHLADIGDADPMPDGKRYVAVRNRDGASQIVFVDGEHGAVTPMNELSLDRVYSHPRANAEGKIVWTEHSGGVWHVGDLGGAFSPEWGSDGALYAVVAGGGFIDIVKDGAPVTRSLGAAMSPAPSPDGALYYMSLEPDGFVVRKLDAPTALGQRPTANGQQSLVPALPPPSAKPVALRSEAVTAHAYGIGRQELSAFFGSTYTSFDHDNEIGLRMGDVVGRLDSLVIGSNRGAALAGVWRGWPVDVGAHLFALRRGGDRGGELRATWRAQFPASRLTLAAGTRFGPSFFEGAFSTHQRNIAAEHVALAADSARHVRATARAAVRLLGMDVVGQFIEGRRLAVGGTGSSIEPESLFIARVLDPALDRGALVARRYRGERAALRSGPIEAFWQRHDADRVVDVIGLEAALDRDPSPIVKAAGLQLTIGVARVRPENRTRGWIAMRWRP